MAFYSVSYLIFFSVFFLFYWLVFNKSIKQQNLFLLFGSYLFYGWTKWHFLVFIIFISIFNFFLGLKIEASKETLSKKFYLSIGILQGIGCLLLFKYYNFFINSLNSGTQYLNIDFTFRTLSILAPLGISFYTFRTLSYLLDIYNGKIRASNQWIVFFNYVSFFPSLLSGPIDKAKTFIPQLQQKRNFNSDSAEDGLRQVLWGVFKKNVIADNCALITNQIFENYHLLPASSLFLSLFFYTIQVYADFSGYSDMAIGFARMIGYKIPKNFDFPFFSQNIAIFWQKWHISLTSWVTEYVFTPLNIAFRDYNKFGLFFAILINFIIIGIWHGANWTFLFFGVVNALLYIPIIINGNMFKKVKSSTISIVPSFYELINIVRTFLILMFTFIIFRSDSISQVFNYYSKLFSKTIFILPVIPTGTSNAILTTSFIVLMLIFEWINRKNEYGLQFAQLKRPVFKFILYYGIIFSIILAGATTENQFIYFKF